MEPADQDSSGHFAGPFSGRVFLKASTALVAASAPVPSLAQTSGQIIAYVGAYTDRGKGIHMFYLNPAMERSRPGRYSLAL